MAVGWGEDERPRERVKRTCKSALDSLQGTERRMGARGLQGAIVGRLPRPGAANDQLTRTQWFDEVADKVRPAPISIGPSAEDLKSQISSNLKSLPSPHQTVA